MDSREIVRNEVLLLLARLGEGHAGVQNLLGFQGAFDKLLDIIEAESAQEDAAAGAAAGSGGGGGGGAQSSGSGRGGVVVHDCLRILSSLLQRNASCCRFFRDAGAMPWAATAVGVGVLLNTLFTREVAPPAEA